VDSCGHEGVVVEECPDLVNGLCRDGVCGCEEGLSGEACNVCVIYVSGDSGADASDGTTWATAKATIQAGLDDAEPNGCEVWVAKSADDYLPTLGTGREATVQLRSGVALYGGFAGDEISLSQRDWEANETVISGDIGTPGDPVDNACHVVSGADTASIDGFTITAGWADDTCPGVGRGGGMRNDSVSPAVANCIFQGNHATQNGGAMFVGSASPTLTDSVFRLNTADGNGGALSVEGGWDSTTLIKGTTFVSNSAVGDGGAINVYQAEAEATESVFTHNLAGSSGGAVFSGMCEGAFSAVNTVVHSNTAQEFGGGLSIGGDGRISNTVVALNTADMGVGGFRDSGECGPYVFNTIVSGNTSPSGDQTGVSCWLWSHSVVDACAGQDGNIDLDPRFVNTDAAAGDIDLSLAPMSPCIDAGNDDEAAFADMLGNDRYDDPMTENCDGSDPEAPECSWISDMGAFEYPGL
jgi:hypothetical protein